jgi:hypothetical protein
MALRMTVENPGAPRPARRRRKTMAKKKKTTRKKNPARKRTKKRNAAAPRRRRRRVNAAPARRRRRRVNAAPVRRRRRRSTATNPKRRTRRNPSRRMRRRNPGWGNVQSLFFALLAGGGAAIASAWIAEGPLAPASDGVQNFALLVEGAAAAYFLDDPIMATAAVVGIGVVQFTQLVYTVFPTLAAPPRMFGGPAAAPGAGGGTLSALHMGNVARLRGMDGQMSALHRGKGMGTLYNMNMKALHRGKAMGNMHADASTLGAVRGDAGRGSGVRGFQRYSLGR